MRQVGQLPRICASSWTVTKNLCVKLDNYQKFMRQVGQLPRIYASSWTVTKNLCVKLDNYQEFVRQVGQLPRMMMLNVLPFFTLHPKSATEIG